MKTVLVLTKPPKGVRRFGGERQQDWYKTLEKVRLFQGVHEFRVIIPSAVQISGVQPELHFYRGASEVLGIKDVHYIHDGIETLGQMLIGKEIITGDLYVACGALHFPRVWWIAKRENISVTGYILGFGLPRIADFFWDPLLAIAYPIFDLMGEKGFILGLIKKRRSRGIL